MDSTLVITGERFCGSVTYQIEGTLRDAKSCHCSRCRKAFNSQASASAFVEPGEFRWRTGEDLLTSHIGAEGFGLQFCSVCGSTLCTVYNGDVYQVTLGCLNGDPDIEIGKHIYVGSKAKWEVIPEDVVQFEEGPPQDA